MKIRELERAANAISTRNDVLTVLVDVNSSSDSSTRLNGGADIEFVFGLDWMESGLDRWVQPPKDGNIKIRFFSLCTKHFADKGVYVVSVLLAGLANYHEDRWKNLLVVARRINECPLACMVRLKTRSWFAFGGHGGCR